MMIRTSLSLLLVYSSLTWGQFQVCPNATLVQPCTCTQNFVTQGLDMQCEAIQDQSQLKEIFARNLTSNDWSHLTLRRSNLSGLGNVFNKTSFKGVLLQDLPNLASVSKDWLHTSQDNLTNIALWNVSIPLDGFPFTSMQNYSHLLEVQLLDMNHWEILPNISIPGSLTPPPVLVINGTKAEVLTSESFENATMVGLYLGGNNLKALQKRSIPISNFTGGIGLDNNNISDIEEGAFYLNQGKGASRIILYLENNNLTTLAEPVFGEIFPMLGAITLNGNPLECSCDMAWLARNSTYLSTLKAYNDEVFCSTLNKPLNNITSADFANCTSSFNYW